MNHELKSYEIPEQLFAQKIKLRTDKVREIGDHDVIKIKEDNIQKQDNDTSGDRLMIKNKKLTSPQFTYPNPKPKANIYDPRYDSYDPDSIQWENKNNR